MASLALPACVNSGQGTWLVSTCTDTQGRHHVAAITSKGELVSKIRLPARGHDALAIPNRPGHALVFSRRPDRYVVEVDFTDAQIVNRITSQSDTHFFGHGSLSNDGAYLFTTENLFDQKHGVVVVRDSTSYQVLERYHSGGIGPHQLKTLPDGKTLVVANGGILTHPDWPRMKLNVDSMHSNIAYIDIASGKIVSSVESTDPQLSLRHLDFDTKGEVTVGAQYQGGKSNIHPLVFSHKQGENLIAYSATDDIWKEMRHYIASVLVTERNVCVSSPRGNQVLLWDKSSKVLIGKSRFQDVAGLASWNGQITSSSGQGKLESLGSKFNPRVSKMAEWGLKFDNHMTTIEVG